MTRPLRDLDARPLSLAWLCALACAGSVPARADEAQGLLREPIQYTDVLDAFDGSDPFDVELGLEFRRSVASATVQRERVRTRGGETFRGFEDVAESQRVTNMLVVGAGLGLYHDLMVFTRLPLVLADTRELVSIDGARCSEVASEACAALDEPVAGADPGDAPEPLFSLDPKLRSARRSGVPALDVGLAWAPLNQYRQRHVPTWVLRAESRIGTGDVMKPCLRGQGCDGGVGRGTLGLALESRWSYRYRHVEPHAGLSYAWEWASAAEERFSPAPGAHGDDPPRVAETTFGAAFIPWEDQGRFERFSVDGRLRAAWVSRGQDYTPLFDALGASAHPSLAGASGLTRADAHARVAFEAAASMRAARYVAFRLGLALAHALPHLVTGASGTLARPVIDDPGHRFRLDGETTLDLFGNATAMF